MNILKDAERDQPLFAIKPVQRGSAFAVKAAPIEAADEIRRAL